MVLPPNRIFNQEIYPPPNKIVNQEVDLAFPGYVIQLRVSFKHSKFKETGSLYGSLSKIHICFAVVNVVVITYSLLPRNYGHVAANL